ncbi:probable cytochrome P450 49a1 isoform X2 [Bicyclus anynana]|uniref:Probable cytochrome P450 49a1 isoform X2 n=1 Tax=Bicyclus anynana TaxID=110368 RepID=A0ABM3LG13_BICAN|nr:probable cytochrome P450 49a1 isoform X2 [Bicyclus anynana]
MQTVRRSVLTLATVSKKFTRSVAVNSASVVTNDESNLKSWKEIPGPSSLPIIGQLLHFLPRGSLHENFVTTVLYDQYGPIVKIDGFFGSPSIVLLFDAEASAQILRGENWMPIRTSFQSLDYFRQNFYKRRGAAPDEPTGLISDQGDVWKKFRSTVNPILLQPKTIKLYTNSLTEVAEDMVKSISEYFVAKAIKEFKSKSQRSTEEKGVLEKLLEINEKVAVIMASDMLFAGVDTASNTMTGTLYLLAKNPDKQKKLREEILSEKEKRPYLKACIKESMRMMPVVAGNLRVTTKEYNILGYKIPKGTHVSFVHQALSNMEKHFPEPEKYIPERWITEKTDPLFHGNAHPFAWNPFGFGVRMCIGRRIAELEIETFLAKVIENFEVEWFGPPLQTRPSSLNYTAGPYNFIFKDVKK